MECGVKPVNRDCGSHTIAEPAEASEATKKDYVTPSSSSRLLHYVISPRMKVPQKMEVWGAP